MSNRSISLFGAVFLVALTACTNDLGTDAPVPQTVSEPQSQALEVAERNHILDTIKHRAAMRGITNALPLAAIASAETNLRQCYDGIPWHCRGPGSGFCPNGVVTGGADGDCSIEQGGIGLFQLDAGTYSQTLARYGDEILDLAPNIDAGIDFVLNMLQTAPNGPQVDSDAAAVAYLNATHIDGVQWHQWLHTVTATYNGCDWWPGFPCNVRYDEYDTHARFVRDLTGEGYWSVTVDDTEPPVTVGNTWSAPLVRDGWLQPFNVQNPHLSSFWAGCFGRPLSEATHAGEDWQVPSETDVVSVGAGEVISVEFLNYPGWVIVVRHSLSEPERQALGLQHRTLFSQYGHVGNARVAVGDWVEAGDVIATVWDQDASNNTHLHWELRSASVPQLCAFNHAGPGYTDFGTNAEDFGYLAPTQTLNALIATAAATNDQRCDNDVAVGATACNENTAGFEYVCRTPGADSVNQWEARACPDGTRCQGDRCLPPCDNGVWMGETACAQDGQTVEYVCEHPGDDEPWRARVCPPLHTCRGRQCRAQ